MIVIMKKKKIKMDNSYLEIQKMKTRQRMNKNQI